MALIKSARIKVILRFTHFFLDMGNTLFSQPKTIVRTVCPCSIATTLEAQGRQRIFVRDLSELRYVSDYCVPNLIGVVFIDASPPKCFGLAGGIAHIGAIVPRLWIFRSGTDHNRVACMSNFLEPSETMCISQCFTHD